MQKEYATVMAYQIATLTLPTDEILALLVPLPYDRTLELLLVLRQQTKQVRSPLNFLRRAIAENWTPETTPAKVNRRIQNHEEEFYRTKGYSQEEARQRARENQQ